MASSKGPKQRSREARGDPSLPVTDFGFVEEWVEFNTNVPAVGRHFASGWAKIGRVGELSPDAWYFGARSSRRRGTVLGAAGRFSVSRNCAVAARRDPSRVFRGGSGIKR